MMDRSNLLQALQTHVPFAAAFIKGEVETRPLLTRIIEALVIAAIGGGASAYIAITNIQTATTVQLADLKSEIKQQHTDTVRQIEDLRYEFDSVVRSNQQMLPPPEPPSHQGG